MQEQQAQDIAIKGFTWLVGEDDQIARFFEVTGISVNDVSQSAAEPEFLLAVIEFLLMEDATVTGFCDAAGLPYDALSQARAALPGGEVMNWT